MRRLAALDVGTNTVLLLVVEVLDDGSIRVLHDSAEITRLGQGALEDHLLKKEPMARTVDAIFQACQKVQELGAEWAGAVTTAAVRQAENGRAFLLMANAVGAPLQVISGEDEAALSFLSVQREPPPGAEQELVMLDIGGGSTELTIGNADGIASRVSVPTGVVRLTEALVQRNPVPRETVAELRAEARKQLRGVPVPSHGFTLVGVAGTVTTLSAIHQGLEEWDSNAIQHSRLSMAQVEDLLARLAPMTLEQRKQVNGLDEKRADVIVAGAALVLESMARVGADELVVSDRGLRWGVLWNSLSQTK